MRIWVDSCPPKGSRFTGQVKITVLEWTLPAQSSLGGQGHPNLSQICCRGSLWIQISIVFSKCGAHITPQLMGKEIKITRCASYLFISRVSFIFLDSAGLHWRHSCEKTDCWRTLWLYPSNPAPPGTQMGAELNPYAADRLEKFIPILEISNPTESLDGSFSTGLKSRWEWGILLEAEGQMSLPGGLQSPEIFSSRWILETNNGKAPRIFMCTDKFSGCSSLRLNFAVEEAELWCQSCVSQIKLQPCGWITGARSGWDTDENRKEAQGWHEGWGQVLETPVAGD